MPDTPNAILDCLPDAVLLIDDGRIVRFANRAARELLETDPRDRDLSLSMRHPDILRAVDTVIGGAPEHTGEATLSNPVSRTFRIHAVDAGERVTGMEIAVVLVLSDITAAKRAEQMRADFVANASHELRSPLAALLGFVETLKGPASEDTQARARFLDIMHRETRRMARLIDDLLSLSRVEINEHIRPTGAVNLANVAANVADLLNPQAAADGMAIRLDIPDDLPPAMGDADELSQVIRNLVENAIKYGRPGAPVVLRAESVERIPGSGARGIAFHVVDQGDGIPEGSIPRLTERFYRVDDSRAREENAAVPSTGLGLAIVKHIIIRHRGRLDITSEIGAGSTFTIHLPVHGTPP